MTRELFDKAEEIVDKIREQERNLRNCANIVKEAGIKIGAKYDRMIDLPDDLAERVSKIVVDYFEEEKQRLQVELDNL